MTPMSKQSLHDIKNLIEWYASMGVTTYVDDVAKDYFAISDSAKRPPDPAPLAKAQKAAPAITPQPVLDNPVAEAEKLAKAAQTLDELKAAMEGFTGCTFRQTATQLVFEDGAREAKIMLVGEAPGRDEDIQGKPFVGRAGQLLDKMLKAIDLDRSQVYIANVVPWRPPGNKTPGTQDVAVCLPFIRRQIELMQPEVLMFMGNIAVKSLMDTDTGILRMRGKWKNYEVANRAVPALATLHPAYLLRQPQHKALAWADLLALKAKLAENAQG